jgi:hypothetical protein
VNWGDLFKKPEFWAAVVLLVKTVLFYFLPQFPKELWSAIDALLAVILGFLTANRVRNYIESRK